MRHRLAVGTLAKAGSGWLATVSMRHPAIFAETSFTKNDYMAGLGEGHGYSKRPPRCRIIMRSSAIKFLFWGSTCNLPLSRFNQGSSPTGPLLQLVNKRLIGLSGTVPLGALAKA